MWRREKITKSHASGVVVLIFIVLFIQGVLFLFGGKEKDSEAIVKENIQTGLDRVVKERVGKNIEKSVRRPVKEPVLIERFDPNTVDKSGLIKLGLSPKQAQVVLNYREKGGKFKNAGDFSRMYVISPKTYERVKEYISIETYKADTIKSDTVVNVKTYPASFNGYENRELLRLNTADSIDLISLPGIGPYYARKIIQYRERLGGFATKDQLLEIYGIDKERFDLFAERIDVDTNDVTKVDLKVATFEQLSGNPYIGGYVARAIIRYREKSGIELTNLANLVMNNIIKKELYKILKYYFK